MLGELEHPKTKTRLIDERFTSVMGEYVFLTILIFLFIIRGKARGKDNTYTWVSV